MERRIGRPLETVSGGATSSYTLVHSGAMPEGINHLRIGENILLAKDLQIDWGIRGMDYLQMDAFTLRAEIIELRRKPTYPQGEFAIDAFGHKPVYTDRGVRLRALVALGRADVGELESLRPRAAGHPCGGRLVRPLYPRRGGLSPAAAGRRCDRLPPVLQPCALRHGAR